MSEEEITGELNETAERLKLDAERVRLKLLCDDLFKTDLEEPDTENEMEIELKQKEKPKIFYK